MFRSLYTYAWRDFRSCFLIFMVRTFSKMALLGGKEGGGAGLEVFAGNGEKPGMKGWFYSGGWEIFKVYLASLS